MYSPCVLLFRLCNDSAAHRGRHTPRVRLRPLGQRGLSTAGDEFPGLEVFRQHADSAQALKELASEEEEEKGDATARNKEAKQYRPVSPQKEVLNVER